MTRHILSWGALALLVVMLITSLAALEPSRHTTNAGLDQIHSSRHTINNVDQSEVSPTSESEG